MDFRCVFWGAPCFGDSAAVGFEKVEVSERDSLCLGIPWLCLTQCGHLVSTSGNDTFRKVLSGSFQLENTSYLKKTQEEEEGRRKRRRDESNILLGFQ